LADLVICLPLLALLVPVLAFSSPLWGVALFVVGPVYGLLIWPDPPGGRPAMERPRPRGAPNPGLRPKLALAKRGGAAGRSGLPAAPG
jgi:hypothetical protein